MQLDDMSYIILLIILLIIANILMALLCQNMDCYTLSMECPNCTMGY